jgi:L-ascorbate metabolism protein UlaG (beta-lactamase superfamily)
MRIQYLGHSCFLVETGGFRVIFDPFISPNPLAEGIKVEDLEVDYVILSHAHEDHVFDAEAILKKCEATLISNWEICTYYSKKGIEKVHPMNQGGKWSFDFGTVKAVGAWHSSSFADGTYGGNPMGFVIETGDKCFYFAGDTALSYDMRLIADQYHLDFAFLPIGDNFTMDLRDAVVAANYVGAKKVIGMHYDTFPYIEIDQIEADMVARRAEIDLILMQVKQTIEIK